MTARALMTPEEIEERANHGYGKYPLAAEDTCTGLLHRGKPCTLPRLPGLHACKYHVEGHTVAALISELSQRVQELEARQFVADTSALEQSERS